MTGKWFICTLAYICFVRGQSPCTTPDQKNGVCKRIDTCEPLYKLVRESVLVQPEDLKLLRRSKCGFDAASSKAKVCCPIPQMSCLTPENKVGQCVNIFDCEHIMKELISPSVTQLYKNYVTNLRCQGNASFSVCCGPPPGPVLAPRLPLPPTLDPTPTLLRAATPRRRGCRRNAGCTLSAQPPDYASNCCGCGGYNPRIFGGNKTGIYQYPWMALIEYQKANKIKLLCGGVLISGRHVLTAGHCVVGMVLYLGEPKNVRLGEYDTGNEGKDCEELDDSLEEECTLDPVVIPIERIIPHPDYNSSHFLKRNDIAIVRLASIPAYTNFVRPICLPTTDITANFPADGLLYTAGWGAVSNKIAYSNVKLHVNLPFKSLEVCQKAYKRGLLLWDHQVCAGGETGKDSCKGDSGGPLMYLDGSRLELVGIVSFGHTPCGLENMPGVYTKVFAYMPWIRNNTQS